MTATNQIKQQILNSRDLLQQLTGIRDDAYNKSYFDVAIEWCEKHCTNDDSALYLATQQEFWGWWSINWAKHTDVFIECIHYRVELAEWHLMVTENSTWWWIKNINEMENAYTVYMKKMMLSTQSNRVILEKSFHNMLKKQ